MRASEQRHIKKTFFFLLICLCLTRTCSQVGEGGYGLLHGCTHRGTCQV